MISCAYGQAADESVPANLKSALSVRLGRTFETVSDLQFVSLGDEVDAIAVGRQKLLHESWRVQIYRISHGRINLKWDSNSLTSIEFAETGPNAIKIVKYKDNYQIYIQSCAPHLCFDGVLGFFAYSGKSGRFAGAKVSTVDMPDSSTLTYNVKWLQSQPSDSESEILRHELQDMMCHSTGISDHSKLPFSCPP